MQTLFSASRSSIAGNAFNFTQQYEIFAIWFASSNHWRLAGLVCAYELTKRTIRSSVFESHRYVGGRIKNVTIDGISVPIGAIMFT
ncbi:MAG: NAD(P)-binding protein [Candidatus Bathyarchaeia archaeon]